MKLLVGLGTLIATETWCWIYAATYGAESIPSTTVSTAWTVMLGLGSAVSVWGMIELWRSS